MITFLFYILCTFFTYLFQLFSLLFYLIMDFLFILFAFFTKIRKKILFHDISVRENQDCKFWKLKKIRIRYAKTIPSPDSLFFFILLPVRGSPGIIPPAAFHPPGSAPRSSDRKRLSPSGTRLHRGYCQTRSSA